MNCPQARDRLPELLYGGLAPGDAAAVESHLAGCADCRRERDALKHVREALDAVPPASAEVDLPRLYRAAAQVQERRSRRWRRAALACGALAAALALAVALPGVEVRCEAHQLTLRWGSPPAAPRPDPPPAPEPPAPEPPRVQLVSTTAPDVEERLRLLSDLVQLLSADADSRDARRRRELDALRVQLNDLREQSRRWRLSTERDVAALYAVQFPEGKKGKEP
jgi:hypothetical protein